MSFGGLPLHRQSGGSPFAKTGVKSAVAPSSCPETRKRADPLHRSNDPAEKHGVPIPGVKSPLDRLGYG